MALQELFSQVESLNGKFKSKYFTFCLYFILHLHVWIQLRIRIGNTDPDPQHCLKVNQ